MRLMDALGAGPGDVVSFVGGGGKTSLGVRLVREATALGMRAIFTVTTRIYPPDLPPDCWVAGPPTPEGKLSGLSFAEVAAIGADLVVVEADGSAGRPLKFPQPHEPVIPPCTTIVVPVVGARWSANPCRPTGSTGCTRPPHSWGVAVRLRPRRWHASSGGRHIKAPRQAPGWSP